MENNCFTEKPLRKKFNFVHADLVELLELMLEFNPVFRPSAADLLKLQIFDKVRVPKMEEWITKAPRISLDYNKTLQSIPVDLD